MAKTSTSKKSKSKAKVEADNKVTVIKFTCPNCGSEKEQVIYCDECDNPMDIDETERRDQKEVEDDIAVSKETVTGKEVDLEDDITNGQEDESEMADLMENGLGDIYPDDGESGFDDEGNIDLTDALAALDNE
jgi:predicted RNA-binding Zn-ribbon protein involved in translation (DUF1610 family)